MQNRIWKSMKWTKKKITIKFRLHATATGIFFILLIIGIITNFYVKDAFKYAALLSIMNEISHNELALRNAEKDFVLKETINPLYFQSHESRYLREFEDKQDKVENNIEALRENRFINTIGLSTELKELENSFEDYHTLFFQLVEVIKQKGFKDYGLVGQMREKIHDVENRIAEIENNEQLSVYMLMLRRHEKDYLLRKDLKYQHKFNEQIENFKAFIQNDSTLTTVATRETLVKALDDYQHLFSQVVEKDVIIGLDNYQGLTKEINQTVTSIEKQINQLLTTIQDESDRAINNAITALFVVSFLLSIGIILILLRVSNHIVKYLKYLQKYITRLGRGELPDKIVAKKEDEIAEMIHSINILTENLKNTRNFAIEVGKGNLNTQVNVFDNKGDLGGSLVEMRNRLAKVAEERKKNEEENYRRTWAAEGIAQFGEILRRNNEDIELFAYDVLSNLVNYLDVNQGGMYIINNDDKQTIFYEQKAAIAYGKRKFMQKRIEIGEDLLGQSIQEKRIIHLEKVPDNYINITSGLGKTTARSVLIVPLMLHNDVLGVVELASFNEFKDYQIEFVERVGKDIATTISTVKINQRTRNLLAQRQEQAEKMIEQEEELRQNVEELQSIQEESARREAEMGSVLRAIRGSFLVAEFDMDGVVLDANEKFLRFFGLQAHQYIGRNHREFTVRRPPENHYEDFWRRLENNETVKDIQHVKFPNGKEHWLSETYTPITDAGGKPHKVLNIAIDLTATKLQERKIKEQAEKLQAQEAAMNQNMEELMNEYEAILNANEELRKEIEELKQTKK